jgi:phage-related protein
MKKPLHWIAATKKAVLGFPDEVKSEVGYTLYLAQLGDKGINAVPLVGFGGSKVLEAVIDDSGNTYRAVYTVKLKHAIYVLHAFQKKAKSGVATPQPDINLIRSRLKLAEAHHKENYGYLERKEWQNDRSA